MKTICLNMIVKDESKAIIGLLESVKGIIDAWLIVDTGSTDGTQEMIRNYLKDIPGELVERPWVNFGHNRNEALDLAREMADYMLTVDADHRVVVLDSFDKSKLWQDFYMIKLTGKGSDHYRPLLFSNDPNWTWEGVIHETLVSPHKMQGELLKDLYVECDSMEGRRSQDPRKYYKDAECIKKAIEEDPENSRYYFYLAESYDRVHEYELALENYEKRAAMPGEPAETFWTLYSIGVIQERLKMDTETIIRSFCKAFEFDSTRAEPLHRLAIVVMNMGCPSLSYIVAKFALELKTPNVLNTNYYPWVYEWGLWCVIGDCCAQMKKFQEARDAYKKVLSSKDVPEDIRKQIQENIRRFPRQTSQERFNYPKKDFSF
jgi:glycosyltransferase involved in cell wall biosynthesis